MTVHSQEPLAAGPSALDEAAHLAAQLHATLLRRVEAERPLRANPAANVLDRLLRDVATPADEPALLQPAAGCRLVVALLSGARSADQLARVLDAGTNVVVLPFQVEELVALVPDLPKRVEQSHRTRAHVIANELTRHDPGAFVGISSAVTRGDRVPAARVEAIHAARLGAQSGQHVVVADVHWAEITQMRLAADLPGCLPIDNPLTRLLSYDAANGTQFAETVYAWLQRNCDTAATASAVCVHPNTLRYRLKRATQLSDLDLDDAATRAIALLVLGVALPAHADLSTVTPDAT